MLVQTICRLYGFGNVIYMHSNTCSLNKHKDLITFWLQVMELHHNPLPCKLSTTVKHTVKQATRSEHDLPYMGQERTLDQFYDVRESRS